MKKNNQNNTLILFIVVCFTILVVSILYLSQQTDKKFDSILSYKNANKETNLILSSCYEMEATARGYVLTKNKKVSKTYQNAKKILNNSLKIYSDFLNSQGENNKNINSLVKERINLLETQIKYTDSSNNKTSLILPVILMGDSIMDKIRYEIKLEKENLEGKIDLEEAELTSMQNNTIIFIIFLSLFVSIIMILSFLSLRKKNEVNERLKANLIKQKKVIEIRNEELETLNEELQQFAYVASHDLQEPLRKIRMFSQLLNDEQGDDKEKNPYISRISNAAERMQILIEDLLSFSRISRNIGELEFLDFNKKITNVLEDISLLIEDSKAEIQVDLFSKKIKAHPVQMKQLFQNLLSNAIKFSKKNENPKISITNSIIVKEELPFELKNTTELSNHYLNINIKDNGIGFENQYANKIFTIFQRLHGKQEYKGTGIGLAICEKICENHDGFIKANSTPGEGATFSIYLPIKN